jgi:hypothetical protein
MPSKDKREICGSISVRIDTMRRKIELSPAEIYGGEEGLYRVRIKRRWLTGPDGEPLFFDRIRLAELLAAYAFREEVIDLPEAAPHLPRNSRVTVNFWHKDMPHCEGVYTATPPWRGFDGKFYVHVMTVAAGFIAVPVEDVTLVVSRKDTAAAMIRSRNAVDETDNDDMDREADHE